MPHKQCAPFSPSKLAARVTESQEPRPPGQYLKQRRSGWSAYTVPTSILHTRKPAIEQGGQSFELLQRNPRLLVSKIECHERSTRDDLTTLCSGCTADQAVSVTPAAFPETKVGQCCAELVYLEQAPPASGSFSQLQGAHNAAVLGGDVILLEASLQSTYLSAQTSKTHKSTSSCKSNF